MRKGLMTVIHIVASLTRATSMLAAVREMPMVRE
jgi:hypothetical protein